MGKRASKLNKPNYLYNKERWFSHYHSSLRNIVWQMFEWKGLPKTINPLYLERMLHTDGHVAFYDDPVLGKMVCAGAYVNLSPYQEPLEFQAAMWRYNKAFPLWINLMSDEVAKELNVGFYCPNMFEGMRSSNNALTLFAGMLAENKMTYLISLNHLKVPFIVETTSEQELTAKNIINSIQENDVAIFVNKNTFQDTAIRVHQTGTGSGTQISIDKINLSRIDIMNEFLSYFGINNFSTSKKERVITNEVSANKEYIAHSLNKFLYPRQRIAEVMSRIWGINVTVDLRENIEEIIQTELDPYGSGDGNESGNHTPQSEGGRGAE